MAALGHMHIKVRNLEEAAAFYTHFLGLQVTERVGNTYVFLTTGKMHHDVALQRVSENAPLPARHAVGLYHVAFEVPDKRTFAETYCTLMRAGVSVVTTDHHISWAMYFSDPSGNGVEVYCDTRGEPDGAALWEGADRPLDERKILGALDHPA